MWKSTLAGIILENIETLSHYRDMNRENPDMAGDILQYVSGIIANLSWHFRLPVIMLAGAIGFLSLILTGSKLNLLSAKRRSAFLRYVRFFPFFGMLNKLVRSMAFMKLFDIIPLSPDDSGNVNSERSFQ